MDMLTVPPLEPGRDLVGLVGAIMSDNEQVGGWTLHAVTPQPAGSDPVVSELLRSSDTVPLELLWGFRAPADTSAVICTTACSSTRLHSHPSVSDSSPVVDRWCLSIVVSADGTVRFFEGSASGVVTESVDYVPARLSCVLQRVIGAPASTPDISVGELLGRMWAAAVVDHVASTGCFDVAVVDVCDPLPAVLRVLAAQQNWSPELVDSSLDAIAAQDSTPLNPALLDTVDGMGFELLAAHLDDHLSFSGALWAGPDLRVRLAAESLPLPENVVAQLFSVDRYTATVLLYRLLSRGWIPGWVEPPSRG